MHSGSKLEDLGPCWLQVGGSWDHLGSKLGVLGAILAPSWRVLGQVGGSWGHLGSKLGGLGGILAPTWGVLGPSWLQDEGSWGYLGSKLGGLGSILGVMARNLRFSWFLWGPGRVKIFEPSLGGG